MGLSLFTEATGAVSMEWKHRALSQLGLRSLGRKVNSESLCTSGDQPEKRKRERENDTERPSSDEARSAALFSEGAFIPWVTYFQEWKIQSHAESGHFYDLFLIKVGQPENLFSLKVFLLYFSNLCLPQKVLNKVAFLWSKGAVGSNKERTY